MFPLGGLLLSAALAVPSAQAVVGALCAEAGGTCALLSDSPFGSLLGIPLPFLGVAWNGLALLLIRFNSIWVAPATCIATGVEFYLLWLMLTVLHVVCLACAVQAALVLALALVVLVACARRRQPTPIPWHVLPVVIMLVFFVLAEPVRSAWKHERQLHAVHLWTPTTAGSNSDGVVLELFSSFSCGHCKAIEADLEAFVARQRHVKLQYRDLVRQGDRLGEEITAAGIAIALQRGPLAYAEYRRRVFATPRDQWSNLLNSQRVASTPRQVGEILAGNHRRAFALGVVGTPTLLLRRGGSVRRINGPVDAASLTSILRGDSAP